MDIFISYHGILKVDFKKIIRIELIYGEMSLPHSFAIFVVMSGLYVLEKNRKEVSTRALAHAM